MGLELEHLGAKAFPGLEVVEFAGGPDRGTQEWFTRFSRDVMAVGTLLSFGTRTLAWHDFHCTRYEMLNVCNADLGFIPGRHDCSSPSLLQRQGNPAQALKCGWYNTSTQLSL